MNKPLLLLAAALLVIGAGSIVGTGTQAAFTDTATSLGNTFATGSIDIQLSSNADCDTGATYSEAVGAVMTSTLKIPGDVATAGICIQSDGTLTTRWDLSSAVADDTSTTTALETQAKIRIWSLTATGATAGTACVAGFDAAGADVNLAVAQTNYSAVLYASATMNTNPSIAVGAGTELTVASPYQKICFSVVLPNTVSDSDPDAATTIQGKTITASFTITGNQV